MQIIAHNLGMLLRIPPKLLLIMRLTTFILIIALAQVSAKGFGQKITLNTNYTPIEKVLQSIRDQSGYRIFYDADDLKNQHVTLNINNLSVEEAIKATIKGLPLNYKIVKNSIVLSKEEPSFLERFFRDDDDGKLADIRGVVRNERGEALEGITVMVKGAKTGTRTNAKGEFLLKGVKKGDVLVFTGVAIEPFEYTVKDDKNIDLNLKARLVQLEEVGINTGYQKISKERFVGSYSQLDSAAYNRRAGMGIIERLDGTVTGVLFDKKAPINRKNPIRIRGISSLGAGDQNSSLFDPLIVVDNFPMDSRFDLNSINPNDIDNITVLKDAAAASIWGSRAGNGVIVITTKKGKYNQNLQVSASSNITITNKPDLFYIPRISVSDFIDIEKDLYSKGFYDGDLADTYSWPVVSPVVELLNRVGKDGFTQEQADLEIDKLRKFDFRNELNDHVYQKAIQQQHFVNFNGGNNNINYLLSLGFNQNRSNIQGSKGIQQFTINSAAAFKPIKNLEFRTGINYTHGINKTAPFDLLTNNSVSPYARLVDDQGNALAIPYSVRTAYLDTLHQPGLMDWRYRPLDEIKLSDIRTLERFINLSFDATYKFTSWLAGSIAYNYRTQMSSTRNYSSKQTFLARYLINNFFNPAPNLSPTLKYPVPVGGILDLSNTQAQNQNIRASLNINKSWGTDNNFTALLGYDVSENSGLFNSSRIYGYDDRNGSYQPGMDYLNYYPTYFGSSRNIEDVFRYLDQPLSRIVSLYLNASYTFKQRYTVYGSARRDGGNVFGVKTNNKWKPLWSVGAKWQLSKEKFYKIDWLSDLSLRGSFGYSGNMNNTGSGKLTIGYSPTNNGITKYPYASVSSPNNPSLKWEEAGQVNMALDFGVLDSRLTGSIEVFQKNSTDLIASYPFDPSSGVSVYPVNSASLRGKGFDFSLNSQNTRGRFQWNTGFGLSYAKTIVTKLYRSAYTVVDFISYNINPSEGKITNGMASFKWAGLDPINGDPQGYLNGVISKDYQGIFNDSLKNQIFHGSSTPLYTSFLSNSFTWKNITLSMNITGRFGYYFRKPVLSIAYYQDFFGRSFTKDYYNRWQKPGDELKTNVPSFIYPGNVLGRSDFYQYAEVNVVRGDNIRLQDIRLQYQWNNKGGNKVPFKGVTFYVYPNNLNIILWRANKSDLDPDFSGGTSPTAAPTPKTWTLGFNFNL